MLQYATMLTRLAAIQGRPLPILPVPSPLVLLTASANAVAEELFFRGALWSLTEQAQAHRSPRQPSPAPPPPP